MYKKIFLVLFLISPLLFLFIGYPIEGIKQNTTSTTRVTSRCYQLGNTKQFFDCFRGHERINGTQLIQQIITDTNSLQSGMGNLLIIATVTQIALIPFLLKKLK